MAKQPRSARKLLQDKLYNIRKRHQRQAKKFQEQAKNAAEGSVYQLSLQKAAQRELAEAEKYKFQNVVGKGASLEQARSKVSGKILQHTYEVAQSTATNERLTKMAKNTLKGSEGKNFYAATRELWEGVPTKVNKDGREVRDTKAINDAIIKGLGVNNLQEAIEKIKENTGYDFESENEQIAQQIYKEKTVVAKGQRYVKGVISQTMEELEESEA